MELKVFKEKILKKEKLSFPFLFVNNDKSGFLTTEYISRICKNLNCGKQTIYSISEIKSLCDNMFEETNNVVLFDISNMGSISISNDINTSRINLILLSNKNTNVDGFEKIIFPTLENWQIEDMMKQHLPGLDQPEIQWLCKITKYDVLRLYNEMQKIEIFDKGKQEEIFNGINNDNGYCDLNDLTIFNLTNAIMKRDTVTIHKIMIDSDYIDIDGMGLTTILLNSFSKLINIQMNPNATAASLNIKDNQFYAIKYNVNKFSNNQLIKIYDFLTSIDCRVKTGQLDMSNSDLNYYIIENIIG